MEQATRVLILGGCYAGISTAINLLDLCSGRSPRANALIEGIGQKTPIHITIVDERDGYYHIIGSPLAFASKEYARKIWRRYSDIPGLQHESISIVQGRVEHVDLDAKRATIGKDVLEYEYLVAATGLKRVWPVVPSEISRDKYLAQADAHIDSIQSDVVVIGGGAVGIEIAAELKMTKPDTKVTLIHSRDRLLSSEPLPDSFKDAVLPLLREQGVEVILSRRVTSQTPTSVTLSDKTTLNASAVINAISRSVPTSTYLPSSVLNAEGYVETKSTLQFHDEYHFAAGDIVQWSGIKRCGGAMHMGVFCAYNIFQHMRQGNYMELAPFPPVIGVAIVKTAATYSEIEGTKSGKETLAYMFGDDLGFTMCWNYMKLSEMPAVATEQDRSTPVLSATATVESASEGPETPCQLDEETLHLEKLSVDGEKIPHTEGETVRVDSAFVPQ